jgi:hypothetical protein
MAKRKPKGKRHSAYLIRRESHVDDSRFFNDQGRRVYFDKPEHARWLMANFQDDQKAKLVYGPVLEGDITYRQLLDEVWLVGTGVTADEYLAAVEKTIDDARQGRDVSRRKARAFLQQMRVLAASAQGG